MCGSQLKVKALAEPAAVILRGCCAGSAVCVEILGFLRYMIADEEQYCYGYH